MCFRGAAGPPNDHGRDDPDDVPFGPSVKALCRVSTHGHCTDLLLYEEQLLERQPEGGQTVEPERGRHCRDVEALLEITQLVIRSCGGAMTPLTADHFWLV